MTIHTLQVFNLNISRKDSQEHAHTLGRAPVPPPSHFSTQSTGVGGGGANESWRIQSWPDVRVPPLLVECPLTERAIWAAESQRQAHPSPCPALWACSQRDRLGELAGISAPRSPAKLEHVLMILAFSGVKSVHDSRYSMRRVGFSHEV